MLRPSLELSYGFFSAFEGPLDGKQTVVVLSVESLAHRRLVEAQGSRWPDVEVLEVFHVGGCLETRMIPNSVILQSILQEVRIMVKKVEFIKIVVDVPIKCGSRIGRQERRDYAAVQPIEQCCVIFRKVIVSALLHCHGDISDLSQALRRAVLEEPFEDTKEVAVIALFDTSRVPCGRVVAATRDCKGQVVDLDAQSRRLSTDLVADVLELVCFLSVAVVGCLTSGESREETVLFFVRRTLHAEEESFGFGQCILVDDIASFARQLKKWEMRLGCLNWVSAGVLHSCACCGQGA